MSRRILPRSFYARPTLLVAADLIGKVLVHRTRDGIASGLIVECEAYIGEEDPACHAAPGPTPRNAPLYGPPGFAYVYFNYGVHYLVNAVTEPKGSPAAVLIRALDPLEGVDLMKARRGEHVRSPHQLCRGPGNLTRALGIALTHNRLDLTRSALTVEDRQLAPPSVAWSPRIGIRVGLEHPWRAYVQGHPAVSGRPR